MATPFPRLLVIDYRGRNIRNTLLGSSDGPSIIATSDK
jgi:hypothetical protein